MGDQEIGFREAAQALAASEREVRRRHYRSRFFALLTAGGIGTRQADMLAAALLMEITPLLAAGDEKEIRRGQSGEHVGESPGG